VRKKKGRKGAVTDRWGQAEGMTENRMDDCKKKE
jgi:hypothetical protein